MDSEIYLCYRCKAKGDITVHVGHKDKQFTEADLCNECYNSWLKLYSFHDNYRKNIEYLLKQQELITQNAFLSFLQESKQPERSKRKDLSTEEQE